MLSSTQVFSQRPVPMALSGDGSWVSSLFMQELSERAAIMIAAAKRMLEDLKSCIILLVFIRVSK